MSPQHKVLVSGAMAELMFGEQDVLVKAKDLVNGDTIYQRFGGEVTYHHILLESHEIIFSEGVPTETLLLGVDSMNMMDSESREEINTLFPELQTGYFPKGHLQSTAPSLRSFEGNIVAAQIANA